MRYHFGVACDPTAPVAWVPPTIDWGLISCFGNVILAMAVVVLIVNRRGK